MNLSPNKSKYTEFEQSVIDTFTRVPEHEVKAFFEKHFLVKLNHLLDSDEKVPAETIRQARIQTKKIQNYLLTFGKE